MIEDLENRDVQVDLRQARLRCTRAFVNHMSIRKAFAFTHPFIIFSSPSNADSSIHFRRFCPYHSV